MQVEINGKLKFVSSHIAKNNKEFTRLLIERNSNGDRNYQYVIACWREDVPMEELVGALNTKVRATVWIDTKLFNQVEDRINLETYSNNMNLININLIVLGKELGKTLND